MEPTPDWHPTWHAFVRQIVTTTRDTAVRVTGPTHTVDVPVDRLDLLDALNPSACSGQPCEFRLTTAEPNLLVITSGAPF